jgi:hypothetical protein
MLRMTWPWAGTSLSEHSHAWHYPGNLMPTKIRPLLGKWTIYLR